MFGILGEGKNGAAIFSDPSQTLSDCLIGGQRRRGRSRTDLAAARPKSRSLQK